MKAGAQDYIVKNADFLENLLPAARKALDKVALTKALEAAQKSTAKNLHLYSFLAQVNLAAAQAKDRGLLFRQICDIAVATGGLRMAWIGLPDRDLGRIIPFCQAGFLDGYLDSIKINFGVDTRTAKGPTGTAASTGRIFVCADIAHDEMMAPWRESALARGYGSSAAIPLEEGGKFAAVLTLYSAQPGFFTGDEIQLLTEIRADISLALDAISSEEKRAAAQAALERTAAQLAHVMDVNPVILFTLRRKGPEILTDWISGNASALTGYTPQEMFAPDWWSDNLHPEDKPAVIAEQKGFIDKGRLTQDFRFRKKNGDYFWVHAQLTVSEGKRDEITGSWTDITKLKESEERFKSLVASSPEGLIVRRGAEILYVNPSGLRLLGAPDATALIGKDVLTLLPEELRPDFRLRLQEVDASGVTTRPYAVRLARPDGSMADIEISGAPINYGGEKCGMVFFRDVSERAKSERMMSEMTNMQRVESLGALAGGIAHDFNNMLMGIMANLSLLMSKADCGPQSSEIIRDTLEAARNAQGLTTQLLAFSKGGKPVKKELCTEKALREIFKLATSGSSAANEIDIPRDLWSVDGDENQLKQAVNNLLVNALQAMPGGGTLRLKAENLNVTDRDGLPLAPGKYIRVTVSDSGIGIPKEYLDRIFEPYFTTKARGHGLGLSMTWSVVKNHGGHIEAASEPGKGTVFKVLLPATGRSLKEAAEKAHELRKGSGRILVLEDENIVQRAAKRMLTELGYECELTSDGAETLRRYAEEKQAGRPFDAVIMDLTIPGGMGGREAGKALRSSDPAARIVVSSGYSDETVMADYKDYGFDAVLPKPYKFEELGDILAALLKK
jgi:PAS domain S-box-containing protein